MYLHLTYVYSSYSKIIPVSRRNELIVMIYLMWVLVFSFLWLLFQKITPKTDIPGLPRKNEHIRYHHQFFPSPMSSPWLNRDTIDLGIIPMRFLIKMQYVMKCHISKLVQYWHGSLFVSAKYTESLSISTLKGYYNRVSHRLPPFQYLIHWLHIIVQSIDDHRRPCQNSARYYSDVIMSTMASQITSVSIVYSIVCSGEDQRKHQRSASLAFVRGIHRWPVTRKTFPFDDVIMESGNM